MNILQSFVGCLYPENIRTDSIESMDHHDFANCRFPASNIDECGEQVSRGELQLTGKDLIYFRPAKEPIRWPLEYIRRYGCRDEDSIFILESGRRSKTGEAIFAFRVECGEDLVNRLREKIEKTSSADEGFTKSTGLCQITHTIGASAHKVPRSPSDDGSRKDAFTSTDESDSNQQTDSSKVHDGLDPRPLSYTLIDFDTTKALNESAQAHAANRVK